MTTRRNNYGYTVGRVVGDYIIGRQIGSGSFSDVWAARHRVYGTEVAVKEMAMDKLNKKLQSSLLYEIQVLRRINHPNIIALHEIIKESSTIYLILEYCKGGDLSMYIQRHGKVPEATANHFMQQLAAGLQVLREHNLIHRDLKPQNLLLSTNDGNCVLKIADFVFARSLQPGDLAETLCGCPLHMAPEIMQLQKYDAKVDLWSVGAILFQLVTGKTPFTGGNQIQVGWTIENYLFQLVTGKTPFTGENQIQLLQNVIKSNELRFPPDNNLSRECIDLCQKLLHRNPVERLTFEEFFNHPFLARHTSDVSASQISSMHMGRSPSTDYTSTRNAGENYQEECLPFPLDDGSSLRQGNALTSMTKPSFRSTYGFSIDKRKDKIPSSPTTMDIVSVDNSACKGFDLHTGSDGNLKDVKPREPSKLSPQGSTIVDFLDFVDQGFVIVPRPPLETSDHLLISASHTSNSLGQFNGSVATPPKLLGVRAPMPICGTITHAKHTPASLESLDSPASGISQGSSDTGDSSEQPSPHCMTKAIFSVSPAKEPENTSKSSHIKKAIFLVSPLKAMETAVAGETTRKNIEEKVASTKLEEHNEEDKKLQDSIIQRGVENTTNFAMFSYSDLLQATSDFSNSNKLGQGGFGEVYKGILRGNEVAIKILRSPGDSHQIKAFYQEIDILYKLNHPHLVRLIGACPEKYALVYEFMPGGTLEARLVSSNLPWQDRICIASEICHALMFLHSLKPTVVHSDLKPENVLLDANGRTKLGDFGICRVISVSSTNTTVHRTTVNVQGSAGYLDPMFIQSGRLTPSVDVYAFGMVLLRLLTNKKAGYELIEEVEDAMAQQCLDDVLDAAVKWPSHLAAELANLGTRCCHYRVRERPNLAEEICKKLELMKEESSA